MFLCHGVQRATVLEPLNLRLVEGVSKLDFPSFAALWMYPHRHRLANGELSAHQVDFVVRVDLVVVFRVNERQREHALLFEVGFVLQARPYQLPYTLYSDIPLDLQYERNSSL